MVTRLGVRITKAMNATRALTDLRRASLILQGPSPYLAELARMAAASSNPLPADY